MMGDFSWYGKRVLGMLIWNVLRLGAMFIVLVVQEHLAVPVLDSWYAGMVPAEAWGRCCAGCRSTGSCA